MKRFKYLALAALVAFAACDEDSETPTPPVVSGTISGQVTVEGAGASGISVALSSGQTTTTDGSGNYTFSNVAAGAYTITISDFPADVTFSSTSKAAAISAAGATVTVGFSGSYIRTASITGTITAGGAGVPGVAVTATGPGGAKSAVSDAGGSYSFTGLRSGTYAVAISNVPAGYTFATTTANVTVGVGEAKSAPFVGTKDAADVNATVVIKSVTAGATTIPVNPAAIAGQIDITLAIDPGTNQLSKVCVLLNGNEVPNGCQTLSSAVAGANGPEAATILEPIFSINTAAFAAATGAVTYPNGNYTLSAKLDLAGAKQSSVETSMQLTFNNADTFVGQVVPTKSAVGANGFLYYGGGNITANVTPVVYSGKTVSSVTVNMTGAGATINAAPAAPTAVPGPIAVTDATAPFAPVFSSSTVAPIGPLANYQTVAAGGNNFVVAAAQYSDGTTVTIPVGGVALQGGTAITVDQVPPPVAGADHVAATADDLILGLPNQVSNNTTYPVCCSNNWVNPNFALAGADLTTSNANARDNNVTNSGGPGVGGVVTTYHMGAAASTAAQIAALPAITTVGESGLDVSLVNTTYGLWARYTDALGNARTVALAATADNPGTTVGIDAQAPQSQALGAGSIADMQIFSTVSAPAANPMIFTATEDRAGFSAEPVRIEIERLTSTNSRWMVFANTNTTGGKINSPTGATIPACAADPTNAAPCVPNAAVATQPAYFRVKAHMNDQGGNEVATDVMRMMLVDNVLPVNQNVSIPGSLVGGAQTTFTVPTADFDLWSGTFGFTFAAFPAGPYYPFGEQVMLGDGNRWDWSLSPTATASQTIPFVRGLEGVTGANAPTGAPAAATGIQFISTDAAGNQSTAQQNNFAAATVPTPVSFTTAATYGPVATFLISNAAVNLCDGTGAACAAANTKTVTPTAQATGASGTFPNPFANGRVYFYWTVDANANGLVDGAEQIYLLGFASGTSATFTDTGAVRTYTYTSPVAITTADLLSRTITAGANVRMFAIGVSSLGDGLLAAHNASITVVAGS